MADVKDILLKIGVVTDVDKIEALGETLDNVLGTYEDNARLLAQYNQQLNDVSASIKALNKIQQTHGKLNANQQAEYAELIKQERELKQGKSELQIIMKNQEKIMQSENGSMKQQSLILGQLRMLYRNLTDEQKAALPQLKTLIDGLDSSLKQADASIGNFQRNVGNYPGLMAQMGQSITSVAASVSPALGSIATGFANIGAAAGPVGVVIGTFAAVFKTIGTVVSQYNDAIAGSATLTYQLRDAMVDAEVANDVLTRRLQDTSGAMIKLRGIIGSLWGSLKTTVFKEIEIQITQASTFFGSLGEKGLKGAWQAAFAASKTLREEYKNSESELTDLITKINAKQKELDKLRENSVVRLAQIEAESAEELLKSRDKEKYSNEERLQAARNYEALMRERTKILKEQAILERDIAILEGERSDNTHEVNMAIEQAKAKLEQLDAQEAQSLRSVAGVRGTVSKQIADEIAALEKLMQKRIKAMNLNPTKSKGKIETNGLFDDFIAESDAEIKKFLDAFRPYGTTPLALALGVTDEELVTIKDKALQAAQQIYGSIQQMAQEAFQRRLDNELKAVETEAEREKAILKAKLDSGVLNEKQYEKKIAEIDKQAEARREEAQREAFEREKRWNILTAIMNTAMGVTAALKQLPSPKAWIEAALVTATGAAQVATISAQKFARGGELHGASHAQGGIKGNIQGHNIELEGDEVVINKRSSRKYRSLLSYINSDNGWGVDFAGVRGSGGYRPQLKYARGGVLGSYDFSPASVPQASILQKQMERQVEQTESLIAATNRRIDRLQVQVNISDIEGASNTKRVHINRAKL